jgi:ATP synthase protein I
MNELSNQVPVSDQESAFSRKVGDQSRRMLKARRGGVKSVWFGLGMSGLVGWSVTVPTLVGAAVGVWVDRRYPSGYSWTLMLLFLGLMVGCFNAWHWVDSEYRAMRKEADE